MWVGHPPFMDRLGRRIAVRHLAGISGAALVVALVACAPLASASVFITTPWQRTTGVTTTVNHGTGVYTNSASSAPPTTSGTWTGWTSVSATSQVTDFYSTNGAYYVNVPASKWGNGFSPSTTGLGGVDLTVTCAPGDTADVYISIWVNLTVNYYQAYLNQWYYSSPQLLSTMFTASVGGSCPVSNPSLVAPVSYGYPPNWATPASAACGTSYSNCTMVLYTQTSWEIIETTSTTSSGCFEFQTTPATSCTAYGGSFDFTQLQVL